MQNITLDAFTAPQLAKLDVYLLAAIIGGFVDYEVGDRNDPRVPIGFTVQTGDMGSVLVAGTTLTALFAIPASGRLTTAHGSVSRTNTSYYFTADVSWWLLIVLAAAPFVTEIQLCANLAPRRPVPRRVTRATTGSLQTASPPRTSNKKILGLIDHGCPFAHRAYLGAHGTRVFSLWDQDPTPDFPRASGTVPNGYGYGRQIDRDTLNGFIDAATVGARVDEDRCYQSALYPVMKSHHTHGSLTMGLLASKWQLPSLSRSGRSEPNPDAMDADVVFVQLPRAVPLAPNRGGVERSTLDGLRYILDCAPDDADVAVVVDYGTEMGPHDGTSWFERALDAMHQDAESRGVTLRVVFPSGNSHEAMRHALVFPAPRVGGFGIVRLGWWLPMSNDTPTPLELWTEDANTGFTLRVVPPVGRTPIPDIVVRVGTPDEFVVWPVPAPTHAALPCCVVISRLVGSPPSPLQRQILIYLSPTANDPLRAHAVPGTWMLEFVPDPHASVGPIHAYAAWGGRNPGMGQRVHASKLIAYGDPLDAEVAGAGSLLGSGCGDMPAMTGGYEKWRSFARAEYSSGGLSRGGRRGTQAGTPKNPILGADWLAVTEQSPVLGGLLCMGTRSASTVRMRGTSLAAPQVARKMVATGGTTLPTVPRPTPPPAGTVSGQTVRPEYGEPRLA